MASLKEIQAALDAKRAGPDLARKARPDGETGSLSDLGQGVRRGLVQFPADVQSMAELGLGRPLGAGAEELRERLTGPRPNFQGPLLRDNSFLTADILPPETFAGKFGEHIGRSLPFVAMSSPVAVAARGPVGLAFEVGSDLLAVTAGSVARASDSSEATAVGVEILTAAMTPGVAVSTVSRRGAKQTARGVRRVRGRAVAEMMQDPANDAVDTVPTETAARIAKDYGLDVEDVSKAISEAKRRMGRDPAGGERVLDRAVEEVEEVIRDFPDPDARPGTVAALGDEGNQNLSSMQKSLASNDTDFSADMDGIRKVVQADLQEQLDRLLPNGGMDGAKRNFDEIEQLLDAEEQLAWSRVLPGESIIIDTRRMKASADMAENRAAGFDARVPDEVRVIRALPDQITLDQFQGIRSNALMTNRVARRGGEVSQFKANNLDPILKALNRELDELPEDAGSAAYRHALSVTKRNKDLLAPDSPYVVAFSEMSQSHRAVRKILGAKDPAAEARKAVGFFSNAPDGEGLTNLRAVFTEHVFGDDLSRVTPRSVLVELRKNRNVYTEVFGEEALGEFEKLVRKIQVSKRTSAGTPGAAFQTGSNVNPFVEALFSTAEAAIDPVQSTARKGIRRMLERDVKSNRNVALVLREMLKDPELFVRMMKSDDDRAVARWIVEWNLMSSRASMADRATRAAGRGTAQADRNGGL